MDEYYPAEEQGIEEAPADEDLAMETGEEDEDPYEPKGREHLREDDEISTSEEGFLEGAEGTGHQGVCAHCKRILPDEKENITEKEIDGEVRFFCSPPCADQGR